MRPSVPRALASLALLAALVGTASAEPRYEGRKKCGSCHRSQLESWEKTAHADAMASLAPQARVEAKRKAGLDPSRDYRQDADCVGCHSTGFGHEGGYDPKEAGKDLVGVGCESCHGPGSNYRLLHRKAALAFDSKGRTAPRERLAEAGQELLFEDRCKACHMNYEGSPWPKAARPYTPFTPAIDPKYGFDFARAVRSDKAMHEHFKLEGVFVGPPLAAFRDEFQSRARPPAEGGDEAQR
ncbi:MAG: multiheme c-type cytochrome [Burkholderiaceae bacterium]|jgi:hypothetical protein